MPNLQHYHRPRTLAEAAALLGERETVMLAGGGLALAGDDPAIRQFVDLQAIPELQRMEVGSAGVQMGGARMLSDLAAQTTLPIALRRSLTRCIPLNLLNQISLGESIACRHHPLLREWIAAIAAYEPGMTFALPDGSTQTLNALNFLQRPVNGILMEMDFPALQAHQRFAIASVTRTPADSALVCAAVFIYFDDQNRVGKAFTALAGVSEDPVTLIDLDSLTDAPLNAATIRDAVATVSDQFHTHGDYKGSAEYRHVMAAVCVRRALLECAGLN